MWDLLINTAGKILGSETKTGESQLLELFKGSQQKQREFEIEMEKQFQHRLEMELKDRMDARGMQKTALQQNDRFAKRFLYYLTMGIVGVTAFLALFPLFVSIPEGSEAMLTRATDFFYMIAGGSVIGFFFGTNNTKDGNKR